MHDKGGSLDTPANHYRNVMYSNKPPLALNMYGATYQLEEGTLASYTPQPLFGCC